MVMGGSPYRFIVRQFLHNDLRNLFALVLVFFLLFLLFTVRLQLVAGVPRMPFAVGRRVVLLAVSALLVALGRRFTLAFSFVFRPVSLVLLVNPFVVRDVHQPAVQLIVREVLLGLEVVLDVGHRRWEFIE